MNELIGCRLRVIKELNYSGIMEHQGYIPRAYYEIQNDTSSYDYVKLSVLRKYDDCLTDTEYKFKNVGNLWGLIKTIVSEEDSCIIQEAR